MKPRPEGGAASTGATARRVALDLLHRVLRRRQPLDETLDAHPGIEALAGRDRAFAYTLAATTLRRLGQIDALVDHCLSRPLGDQAETVHDILRLGICQLVFLETPPHAAIHTSVELAKRRRQVRHLGLINAVLRRVSREGAAVIAGQDAARLNTPDWLWQSWTGAYGAETCRDIAAAHLVEPHTDLTAKGDPDELAQQVDGRIVAAGTVRVDHRGPITGLPGFATGDWWVQDAAAALPARLLGEVRGRRVIDLCAAPGGKTAQMAAAGARVTAVDRSPRRLARLADNLTRLGLSAETVSADALAWRPPALADAVLLDAPCSATGTIRRHPDVAQIKTPEDVAMLASAQKQLLRAATEMLAPGGLLVYSVCSLQPEEGPDVVPAAGAENDQLAIERLDPAVIGGIGGWVTPEGALQTLPCHLADEGGMDGFFAVRLRRA